MGETITEELQRRLAERERKGIEEYGVGIDAAEGYEWIDEAVDELLDAAAYLLRKQRDTIKEPIPSQGED